MTVKIASIINQVIGTLVTTALIANLTVLWSFNDRLARIEEQLKRYSVAFYDNALRR